MAFFLGVCSKSVVRGPLKKSCAKNFKNKPMNGKQVPHTKLLRAMMTLLLLLLCLTAATTTTLAEDYVSFPLERRKGTGFDHNNKNSPGRRDLQQARRTIGYTRKESDGVYWATIRIGSPIQQSFTVIVDTGSSTIAVPCKGCDCGARHAQYDVAKSSSVKDTGRKYNQCYSEGSCNSGHVLSDLACFGRNCRVDEAVRHEFGCSNTYAPAFKAQDADGIIGLSGSSDTLVASLRAQNNLHKDMFAMCLGRQQGLLTVGGVYHRPLLEEFQYVPLSSQGVFYQVQVSGVFVDNEMVVGTGSYTPIIDSGSTFTYFPRALHQETKKLVDKFCSTNQGIKCLGTSNPPGTPQEDIRDSLMCFSPPSNTKSVSDWLVQSFPQISIQYSSETRMCLSPASYFFKSKPNVFCAGIFPDRSNRMVLGAISMADYSIVFDHEKRRVGFAKSNCDGDPMRRFDCCGKNCTGYTYVAPEGQTLRPTKYIPNYDHLWIPPPKQQAGEGKTLVLDQAPTMVDSRLETGEVGIATMRPTQVNMEVGMITLYVSISALLGAVIGLFLYWLCVRKLGLFRFTRLVNEDDDDEEDRLESEPVEKLQDEESATINHA